MAKRKPSENGTASPAPAAGKKRVYVNQGDVPRHTLDEALVVPETISRQYAKKPTKPLDVAVALELKPNSSQFRTLCGAALAYGMTDGGPTVDAIGLTDLGKRIVAPTKEGDDVAAKRQALMQPRVMREFLTRYNGSPLPSQRIGQNVLEELGVPPEVTERTFNFIVDSAASVGMLREIKGDRYVDLEPSEVAQVSVPLADDQPEPPELEEVVDPAGGSVATLVEVGDGDPVGAATDLRQNRRVFITHGRNKKIVDQVKELLVFGDFEPVVSAERETVSKPVPDKVMDDMRSCAAAVIHVGTEMKVMDQEGEEHRMLNQNVLIEIGAAMALYRRKFILLVEKGAELPSNLQGLYEVRYEGNGLDHESTMKLLKAFNDFRA